MDTGDSLRRIPSVEVILNSDPLRPLLRRFGRSLVVKAVREVVEGERAELLSGERTNVSSFEEMGKRVARILEAKVQRSMRSLVNATGVVLHTNLGRAILSPSAVEAVRDAASHYTNLEYDVARGERSTREVHLNRLLCELTGAEASHVVNNNAGAILLALNSLAEGKEVVVSRGELVEIGGSFRLPDVMAKSGSVLAEVGTTNRTTVRDYENAISDRTAMLLKVHRSNFRMTGFVAEVSLDELVDIGKRRKVAVMEDLGSGALVDFGVFGLPGEPVVADRVAKGADVVTFSGDKLLGGPQAGIIVGRRELVARIKENPLGRALRIDKLTVVALEATLLETLDSSSVREKIPSITMITETQGSIKERSEALISRLGRLEGALEVRVEKGLSQIGGGALPEVEVPTWLVSVTSPLLDANSIEKTLREGEPSIIARIAKGAVYLDLRTVLPDQEPAIEGALRRIAESLQGRK